MDLKRAAPSEQDIDEQLTETFPASDPPSWTLGRDPGKSFMKAMRIGGYGGPEQLRCENVPVPQVSRTDILVRVRGASVNPIDCKLASGALKPVMNNEAVPLPWIPGCDFSGVVENTGGDVIGFKKGDEVYGNCPSGGSYAQFVIAQPDSVAIKPQKLEFMEAAAVPVAGLTAWQALFDHGHLEKGQTVLVHGGSGGVGSFETQGRSFNLIKEGENLVSTVSPPSQEAARQHKVHAVIMTMRPSAEQLKKLSELLIESSIKTHVTKVYLLTRAQEAWADILSHHTKGKIVLRVSDR